MADDREKALPIFDSDDQALFRIDDAREKVDGQQARLIPKLRVMLDEACDLIRGIYGIDPLLDSTITSRPANRKNAAKTVVYDDVYVGIGPRRNDKLKSYTKPDGAPARFAYFWLVFELLDTGLGSTLRVNRPPEARLFFEILRSHEEDVVRLLDGAGCWVWCEEYSSTEASDRDIIQGAVVPEQGQWWHAGLGGEEHGFPILEADIVREKIDQFVALFPVYQAMVDRFFGREDRFAEYFARLEANFSPTESTDDRTDSREGAVPRGEVLEGGEPISPTPTDDSDLDEELSAYEGEERQAMRRHRAREGWIRAAKIRQALRTGMGRLKCEVPGCGFDFFEVYGEIGEGYAQVHHLNPLGDRSQPSETRLSDLAIVCANCHVMIHKGGKVRPLEGLIKLGCQRPAVSPEGGS